MSAGIALRPYQRDALAAIGAAALRGIRRAAIQIPTGGGKTVTFGHLVAEHVRRGDRALVLAHREELIDQAAATIGYVLGDARAIGIVRADHNTPDAAVIVGSVPTLRQPRRLEQIGAAGRFSLVVVDEAHHSAAQSYQTVLAGVGALDDGADAPQLLGVSATLTRADGRGLAPTYQEIVYQTSLIELIRQGYLCDFRGLQIALAVDLASLPRVDGDYAQGALGEALSGADAPVHIATALAEHASGRVSLVFAPTIAVAEATVDACRGRGLHAALVTGATPTDERAALFAAVRAGELPVLVNVGVATEGVDLPRVDCVCIARPTRSPVLYQQMLGRGARKHPAKADCLVLDCVGATGTHDLMTAAVLFETPAAALADGVLAADAAQAAAREAAEQGRAAALTAREVALFAPRDSRIAWLTVDGSYAVSMGDGVVILSTEADGTVDVLWQSRETRTVETVHRAVPSLELAQGVAEELLRADPARWRIARADARWRSQPASDGQRAALRAGYVPGMSKGAAADALTRRQVRRIVAGRGWQSTAARTVAG
ncbi:DEAD/DEAH box helicase [bacterium]|nr:DEAD/DEAH box helicase [bacterium]